MQISSFGQRRLIRLRADAQANLRYEFSLGAYIKWYIFSRRDSIMDVCVERERERETEREREIERERLRQIYIQADRQTDRERQRERVLTRR